MHRHIRIIHVEFKYMGVPFFFAWLMRQYKSHKMTTNNPDVEPDILYLDANCLFHPQCFNVIGLLEGNSYDTDYIEDKMFNRIIKYIDYLVGYVSPRLEVFISVDGVAPLAKINQQRKRRYKSVDDAAIREKIRVKHGVRKQIKWNNTVITPGTEFMERLHKRIEGYIATKGSSLKWTYSSYHVPGEGEHKILDYIRANRDKKPVIYGLDADLLFLSISSGVNDIHLLRESTEFGKKVKTHDNDDVAQDLTYVSIENMKDCIYNHVVDMVIKAGGDGKCYDRERICNDFVFICYLLGNDFLPHLPSINIKRGGIEVIMNCYIDILISTGEYMIDLTSSETVNMTMLDILISSASGDENGYLVDSTRGHKGKRCYVTDPYEKEIWELENMQAFDVDDPVGLGYGMPDMWKYRYYNHYFGVSENYNTHVDNMCESYLQGMMWVTRYYFKGVPSWRWQYLYTHAPFISDIGDYIKRTKCDINKFSFVMSQPLRPCAQLLSVIPPECNGILPKSYRYLMTSDESPLIDLFPTQIALDMIDKDMYWQCVPMLPNIDADRIEQATKHLPLVEEERRRNMNS
jgi:5'-3' exonuclease